MTKQLIGSDNNFFFIATLLYLLSPAFFVSIRSSSFSSQKNSPFILISLRLYYISTPDCLYSFSPSIPLLLIEASSASVHPFTTASAVASMSLGTSAIDPALRSSSSQVRDVPDFTSPQEGDGSSSMKFEGAESAQAYHSSNSTTSFPPTTEYPETSAAEYVPSAAGLSALASAASDQTSYIRYVDDRNPRSEPAHGSTGRQYQSIPGPMAQLNQPH